MTSIRMWHSPFRLSTLHTSRQLETNLAVSILVVPSCHCFGLITSVAYSVNWLKPAHLNMTITKMSHGVFWRHSDQLGYHSFLFAVVPWNLWIAHTTLERFKLHFVWIIQFMGCLIVSNVARLLWVDTTFGVDFCSKVVRLLDLTFVNPRTTYSEKARPAPLWTN